MYSIMLCLLKMNKMLQKPNFEDCNTHNDFFKVFLEIYLQGY